MRDFRIILRYELMHQLGKRSVQVTTLILVIVALLGTSMPRILHMINGGDKPVATEDRTLIDKVGYNFASAELQEEYTALLKLEPGNLYDSRDALVAALKARQIEVGIVLSGDTAYEALYHDKGIDDTRGSNFGKRMAAHVREKMLAAKGLTVGEFQAIESFEPQETQTVMGVATENNIMLSMVMMVLIYMLVLIYGNITSVMIAREKDSKAMELLITSSRPTPLICGKVAAAGVSGIVQFGLVILAAITGFLLSQDYYSPIVRYMLLGSLNRAYVLSFIYFTVTGYTLYLFLYAALGSTVSRVEDVNSATALVQVLMILGYVSSSFIMSSPNGVMAKLASIFPFTSIIIMPLRVGLTTVPAFELILSGALMALFILFFAWLSIKIYRWGSLNYGNKTSILKVMRSALRLEKRKAA